MVEGIIVKYKVGQIVAVLYDGKWSRAVKARVTVAKSRYIELEFMPWVNEIEGLVRMRATNLASKRTSWLDRTKRRGRRYYGGFLNGQGELGIMRMLGVEGDFYSVLPCKDLLAEGYNIGELIRPVRQSQIDAKLKNY